MKATNKTATSFSTFYPTSSLQIAWRLQNRATLQSYSKIKSSFQLNRSKRLQFALCSTCVAEISTTDSSAWEYLRLANVLQISCEVSELMISKDNFQRSRNTQRPKFRFSFNQSSETFRPEPLKFKKHSELSKEGHGLDKVCNTIRLVKNSNLIEEICVVEQWSSNILQSHHEILCLSFRFDGLGRTLRG